MGVEGAARRDHKRGERARKKSGCGGGVPGLVELVLSGGGICVRDGEVSGAVLGCRAGPEVSVSERVIPC